MKSFQPQPWKMDSAQIHRYILNPDDTIGLAVNIQEWPCNSLDSTSKETFVRNCTIVLRACRALHVPVLAVERFPERFGPTVSCLDGFLWDVTKITKLSGSCWRDGRIRAGIKGMDRKTVLLIGMEAHLCIIQTVMDLLQTGYNPVVAADAVCSLQSDHTQTALIAMMQAGAVTYPSETIACMLLDKADPSIIDEIMSFSRGDMPNIQHPMEAART